MYRNNYIRSQKHNGLSCRLVTSKIAPLYFNGCVRINYFLNSLQYTISVLSVLCNPVGTIKGRCRRSRPCDFERKKNTHMCREQITIQPHFQLALRKRRVCCSGIYDILRIYTCSDVTFIRPTVIILRYYLLHDAAVAVKRDRGDFSKGRIYERNLVGQTIIIKFH